MEKDKKKKKPFSIAKAKKILAERHPTLRGHNITQDQRGLLHVMARSGTPRLTTDD